MDFTVAIMDRLQNGSVLEKFRLLMNDYWLYARAAIIYTRSYHGGLEFVSRLESMYDKYVHMGELKEDEIEDYDRKLILFRLQLYDKLDWWQEYVELFDSTIEHRAYFLPYVEQNPGRFPERYVIDRLETLYKIHFLYLQHHRYQVIKRKNEKQLQGRKTGNLRHKSQAELSEEQIREKFDYIMKAAEKGMDIFEPT